MARKQYKRYKAKTPECRARIAAGVRAYHARAKQALAQVAQGASS